MLETHKRIQWYSPAWRIWAKMAAAEYARINKIPFLGFAMDFSNKFRKRSFENP